MRLFFFIRLRRWLICILQPWYLTTLAVAEQLHLAISTWTKEGSLTVTSTSLPFFQLFIPSINPGTYDDDTSTFTTLIDSIGSYADEFITTVAKYTPSNGALAEQFLKGNGQPTSANDLTWSYASLLTLANARDGSSDKETWGAKGLKIAQSCNYYRPVSVTFTVNATTSFGGTVPPYSLLLNHSHYFPSSLQRRYT